MSTTRENIRKGHRNQENGAAFEKMLSQLFHIMEDCGYAKIAKIPEPLRVLGPAEKGVWRAIFIRTSVMVDYQGTLIGGRAVYLEAKYTRSSKMEQDRVAERQAEALDKYAALGASCGVLVSFGAKCCGVVPWAAWRQMKEIFGRKYIRADDLERMKWTFQLYNARGLCQLLHGLILYQLEKNILT